MHGLFSYTELVQYLCLMYRQHHPKDPVDGREKEASTDLISVSQARRETQNLDESVRITAEKDNWS